jgi:chromosome partitioning protein
MSARVVTLAMQKGGVGKTTSTCNKARAAARRGLRVLVVDMDPQGNTTSTLARDEVAEDQFGVADTILPKPDAALAEVIVPTIWDGVDLAPAVTEPLTAAEDLIGAAKHGREHRLAEALAPLLDRYDLVLIDTPPALGLLTINALAASDLVVVVAEADQWSADGLAMLRKTVDGVRKYSNARLSWSGILVNRFRGTRDEEEMIGEIGEYFPEATVWPERIPLWVGIKTTLNAGLGLDESKETRLRVLADQYAAMVGRVLDGSVAS